MMPLNTFTQQINGLSVDRQVIAQIITLKDNLTHPYFSSIDISRANSSPIGIAKFHAAYDQQIVDYWAKYDDVVIISFNISDLNRENTNSLNFSESNNLNGRIQNEEYNYSFICKVSRVKQKGKEIIIFLEDLGWKFLQKVPTEFRQTYIANQYLDDAFQAICEFLDVHFAYSIEDLHAFQFGADGYSITKDGQNVETVQNIFDIFATTTEDVDPLDDPMFENEGLIDFLKGKDDNVDISSLQGNKNEPLSDDVDTSVNEKKQKYEKDFDQKIMNLFIGNSYYDSDLVHPVLDYGRITVTPSGGNGATTNVQSTDEETEQQSAVNQQMHESSQKTVKTLTKLTKAILSNPKATKALTETLLPKNAQQGSLAQFLKDASTDKEKQKLLLKGIKTYVGNQK